MSASVNDVTIIGNLGNDPGVRFTSGGKAVCNFNVATTETWMADGEKCERTEWHRIVVWGKQAEACGDYLHKGSSVYVRGSIKSREWEDKEGNKRTAVEINGRNVEFLGGKSGGSKAPDTKQEGESEVDGDDIPF